MRKPEALLVAADEATQERLGAILDDWGWTTSTCPGPSGTRCPLMTGGVCELRSDADAAVVFVDPDSAGASGALPKVRCAADSSSPFVLALEGRVGPPEDLAGGVSIGARRGEEAIAYAVVRSTAD